MAAALSRRVLSGNFLVPKLRLGTHLSAKLCFDPCALPWRQSRACVTAAFIDRPFFLQSRSPNEFRIITSADYARRIQPRDGLDRSHARSDCPVWFRRYIH